MGWGDAFRSDSDYDYQEAPEQRVDCPVCGGRILLSQWPGHQLTCQIRCPICSVCMSKEQFANHSVACETGAMNQLNAELFTFANDTLQEEKAHTRRRLAAAEGTAWVRTIPDVEAWTKLASKASWGSTESVKLLFVPGGVPLHEAQTEEDALAIFNRWDTNGDGMLSLDEFKAVLEKIGASPDFVADLFSAADMDQDGLVNYSEFLAWIYSGTGSDVVWQSDQISLNVMFVSGGEWHYLLMQEYKAVFWPLVKDQLNMLGEGVWPVGAYAFNKSFYSGTKHAVLLAGVTYYQQQDRWCLDLNPADLDGADVGSSQDLLRSALKAVGNCAFFGDKLSFHPTSPAQVALVPPDLPLVMTDELFSGVTYQPLTLGTAIGVLRIMRSEEEEVAAGDVAVFEKAPNDIGPVAALLTSELQTPLAHTALLCGNRGTPNAGIPGIWSDPKILALEGKPVKLLVEADRYELTETQLEDVIVQAKDPISLPYPDLSITSLVPATSESNCIGAKARQYGELEVLARRPNKRLTFHEVLSAGSLKDPSMKPPLLITTLESFVVPFGCAVAHLKSSVPDISPDLLRSHEKGELYNAILATDVESTLVASIMDRLTLWPTSSGKVIFRSSTNCEDLPGFNGAGLYKSVPAAVSAEEVADAVRKVWASVWTERARAERKLFGIDDAQVAVAVLVQPFVDKALANGVALTANPRALRLVDGVYLNSFPGANKRVTDGAGSEELFVHFERALGEADVEVMASTGTPVLDPEAARGVASACLWVHRQSQQELSEQGACLDMEWLLINSRQPILALPVRRWFYLGGYFADDRGSPTTDPQYPLNFPHTCWYEYTDRVARVMSMAYDCMRQQQGDAAHGQLINTEIMGSDYEVWKGKEVVVRNPRIARHLLNKPSVAGFPVSFWQDIANSKALLPSSVAEWVDQGVAKITGGFYQIHANSVDRLPDLESYLQDGYCMERKPKDIRKRVVMMVEFPPGWSSPCDQPAREVVLLQSRPFKLPEQRLVREQGQGPPQWVGPGRPHAPTVFSSGWAWVAHAVDSDPIFSSGPQDMCYGQRLNRWWSTGEGAWKAQLAIGAPRGRGSVDILRPVSIGMVTKAWKNEWRRGANEGFYGISFDSLHGPLGQTTDSLRPPKTLWVTVTIDLVNHIVLVEGAAGSASARFPDGPVALCVFSESVKVALRCLEPCDPELEDTAAALGPIPET